MGRWYTQESFSHGMMMNSMRNQAGSRRGWGSSLRESVRVFHPRPRANNDEGFADGYG